MPQRCVSGGVTTIRPLAESTRPSNQVTEQSRAKRRQGVGASGEGSPPPPHQAGGRDMESARQRGLQMGGSASRSARRNPARGKADGDDGTGR